VLELNGLSKHFGGVRAVDGVSLNVSAGEVLGLIGPNGSGKSTIVNLICGLFPLTAGEILLDGKEITSLPDPCPRRHGRGAHISEYSPVRTIDGLAEPLGRAEFRQAAQGGSFLRRWLAHRAARAEIDRTLEFFNLAKKRDELAANLSFGEQRRIEMARAMAANPSLLLLDEPAAGMNAEEIEQLDERIRTTQDRDHDLAYRASHGTGHGGNRPRRGAELWTENRRGRSG
jgi:ABC-type branched-subunit amino acid transport system ATPase component